MAVSLSVSDDEHGKDHNKQLMEAAARLLLGLVVSYIRRRMRKRKELGRERRRAERHALKLASKGKEVEPEVLEQAEEGLSFMQRRKLAKKMKAKAKKAKKKRGRKVFLLILLAAAAFLLYSKASKKISP